MRILGYALIIFGFITANAPHQQASKVIGAIAENKFQSMPKRDAYSPDDLLQAMHQTGQAVWDDYISQTFPPYLLQGVLMVVGVVFVDIGARRGAVAKIKLTNGK